MVLAGSPAATAPHYSHVWFLKSVPGQQPSLAKKNVSSLARDSPIGRIIIERLHLRKTGAVGLGLQPGLQTVSPLRTYTYRRLESSGTL